MVVLVVGCRERRAPDPALVASSPSSVPAAPAASGPTLSAVTTATPKPAACPADMALIDGRFCIDRWEARVREADGSEHSPFRSVGPKKVVAETRAGVIPQAYISEKEADAACRRAGRRLCTTKQWVTACMGQGKGRRQFPYGAAERHDACNTHRPIHPSSIIHGERRTDSVALNDPRLNQVPNTIAKTGEFDQCVTPEGVYDLHGNLLEWTRGEKPLLMGGHYLDGVQHGPGCTYVTDAHGADYHDFTTGFRCCMPAAAGAHEPEPESVPAVQSEGDPTGMRGFELATGRLPELTPPPYEPADAACPADMVLAEGLRCSVPIQRCKRWLPRTSVGEKIACAEFAEPSECTGSRRSMRYCIDRYELTPPGYGLPLTHVNWTEAQNLCRAMDKRLCMEDEWEFACEGPDALPYPYGYVRDAKRCNHDFPEEELVTGPDQFIDHRVAKDARPECTSPFGVVNMVGNVDEWTTRPSGEPGHRAILRGGWWLIGRNRCRAATSNHGERYAGMQTGVRCCKAARGQ